MPGQNGSAHLPGTYVPVAVRPLTVPGTDRGISGITAGRPRAVRYVRDDPRVHAIGDKSSAQVKTTTLRSL